MAEICYNIDCPYFDSYKCARSCTCITRLPDGYWYHGNGKLGGEFHPTKPDDKEHYGEYVKVVRCKDCKWWEEPVQDFLDYGYCVAVGRLTMPKPNDFCSRGVRKDEAEE